MKQTAKNNDFLKIVKWEMNEKIYKKVLSIINTSNQEEAENYLNTIVDWNEIKTKYAEQNVSFHGFYFGY